MKKDKIDYLVSQLFATGRIIQEHTKSRNKIDPFSHLQLETLRYVAEKDNPSMKEIASYLCVTSPSATSIINWLVKAGQLKRIYDAKDRRIVRLNITAEGKIVLGRCFKKILGRMQEVLKNLNEKEINDFIKILEKLSSVHQK